MEWGKQPCRSIFSDSDSSLQTLDWYQLRQRSPGNLYCPGCSKQWPFVLRGLGQVISSKWVSWYLWYITAVTCLYYCILERAMPSRTQSQQSILSAAWILGWFTRPSSFFKQNFPSAQALSLLGLDIELVTLRSVGMGPSPSMTL